MNWFLNLKINKKLVLSFILISLIFGIMGGYAIKSIKSIDDSDEQLYEDMTIPISIMGQIETESQKLRVNLRNILISHSLEESQENIKNIENTQNKIDELSNSFSNTNLSDNEKRQFDDFMRTRDAFKVELDKVMELIKENKNDEVIAMIGENGAAGKASKAEEDTIEKLVSMKIDMAKQKADLNAQKADDTTLMMIISIGVTIVISILIGLYISSLISKPIKRTLHMINEMSKGHFSERLNISTQDEVGQMAKAMDFFADELQDKVIDVMNRISQGDVSIDINVKDEKDEISPALKKMIENIKLLVIDANMLSSSAAEGNLNIRVDATKHSGDFKKIVDGLNELVEVVMKPISEISGVMSKIAERNLAVSVKGNYRGEFGVLSNSVNTTIDSLNSVLDEINVASDQVFIGSSQVSDGSQALSQGATEQASAIEELTSSITEIAAQTRENATNANEAKELALDVKDNAEKGNIHMGEMLKSMGEINESSSNISKIIKVIDEIAFQTNILALNAAVEAARAGQHGKGFAVVAEEVRNLAARSANAAKETTDLIEGSIRKAEKGTEIANDTAKALYKMVDGVSKATKLIAEIAASSEEQATGISQINLGIEQVSDVVQTNSATAEESAAASEELSSQSRMLKDMISNFKLKNSNRGNLFNNNFNNKQYNNIENNKAFREAAATSNKSRIILSDNEFGKY